MPQGRHLFRTTKSRLLLAAALGVLGVMPARRRKNRIAPRRLAATLAFATLFFAGAAFSAGAGNTVTQLLEPGDESAVLAPESATTSTEEDPAADSEAGRRVGGPTDDAEEAPAAEASPAEAFDLPVEATPVLSADSSVSNPGSDGNAWRAAAAPAGSKEATLAPKDGTFIARKKQPSKWVIRQNAFRRSAPPVLAPRPLAVRELSERDPEVDEPGVSATIWLNRTLPDPTPPSRRLKPSFARQLSRASAGASVDWALVLGVLRASGERGSVPASPARLRTLSNRLAKLGARRNPWSAALALEGRTSFADRAIALQRYNRAVGLRALVKGLEWAKPRIAQRILQDARISIYPGGQVDIQTGRTDIRILVLVRYLAEAHGTVTLSSLTTGHRLYSRPGVISAHSYGLAVDVAALGGLSIMGNSAPGGRTEEGVRNILLLPAELQPRQVISLLGMGGPSFPMGNHDDHIHVGY
ncbi:MAG: hypothetical protein H0V11_05140 [Actinobacteria bacterium]|nr:hypothetical protein [Actinomycetota bacterium]